MRVKCVICESIETIDGYSPEAKKLLNKPIKTYLCPTCNQRITDRTNERMTTGKFKLYKSSHPTEEEF